MVAGRFAQRLPSSRPSFVVTAECACVAFCADASPARPTIIHEGGTEGHSRRGNYGVFGGPTRTCPQYKGSDSQRGLSSARRAPSGITDGLLSAGPNLGRDLSTDLPSVALRQLIEGCMASPQGWPTDACARRAFPTGFSRKEVIRPHVPVRLSRAGVPDSSHALEVGVLRPECCLVRFRASQHNAVGHREPQFRGELGCAQCDRRG